MPLTNFRFYAFDVYVAVYEGGFVADAAVIDEYAVLASHIQGAVPAFGGVVAYLHVFSGDLLIENLDGDGLGSSDYAGSLAQGVEIALLLAWDDYYAGHLCSLCNCHISAP